MEEFPGGLVVKGLALLLQQLGPLLWSGFNPGPEKKIYGILLHLNFRSIWNIFWCMEWSRQGDDCTGTKKLCFEIKLLTF